jgi:hypothetical protein
MDYGAMLTDSLEYAKEALLGKWVRWILFIILGLPFALVKFTIDPVKITDTTTGAFHPELIPWDQLLILISAGILLGFFIAGYMVRVYRGTKPAPEFDNWAGLFIDGLKLNIVWFCWLLPFLIVMVAALIMIVSILSSMTEPPVSLFASVGILLVLILIGFVLAIFAFLYGYLGVIRFARTGKIREGLRFSKIREMIRVIGWRPYIIALLVMVVVGFAFGIVTSALSIIPFIGWILVLIITPFITILFSRYATLVYGQGENQPGVSAIDSKDNPEG